MGLTLGISASYGIYSIPESGQPEWTWDTWEPALKWWILVVAVGLAIAFIGLVAGMVVINLKEDDGPLPDREEMQRFARERAAELEEPPF